MTIYLTIITTVLVLTQIIRVLQNYEQLKHISLTDKRNERIVEQWNDIAETMYKVADKLDKLNQKE